MGHWTDGIEEKVIAGYLASGRKATSRAFAPTDKTAPCCALGALRLEDERMSDVVRALGGNDVQKWDFTAGFDDIMEGHDPARSTNYNTVSYQAGVRTARAVINAGLRE